jgi:hypothetical protein
MLKNRIKLLEIKTENGSALQKQKQQQLKTKPKSKTTVLKQNETKQQHTYLSGRL